MFIVKRIWFFKIIKNKIFGTHKKKDFISSQLYWEKRYNANNNSGPGSYGRLAKFKAEVLNNFVSKHTINTVIEYGCGDGNQLTLAKYPKYIGFDVSNKALEICRELFKDDTTKAFYHTFDVSYNSMKAELTLSLDVIYHLVEDALFETYMKRLFESSQNYVIIYSSNYNERSAPHVRSRKFTNWIDTNVSRDWDLIKVIKNKYPFKKSNPNQTSMSDFYIYKKLSL